MNNIPEQIGSFSGHQVHRRTTRSSRGHEALFLSFIGVFHAAPLNAGVQPLLESTHMNSKEWLRKLCWLIAIGTILASFGCDGLIRVRGKVYARRASGGVSQAYVDELAANETDLSPLEGVKITVYHGGDYATKPIDKSTQWQDSSTTDSQGAFTAGSTTAPFRFHAALTAEKDGYKPVTKVFLHDKKAEHEAVIVLVPEDSKPAEPRMRPRPNSPHEP